MSDELFDAYMETQREEIMKYKWCKGEELGYDPGDDAIFEWIKKYAKKFRHDYMVNKFNEAIALLKQKEEEIAECIAKLEDAMRLDESPRVEG